MNINVEAGTHQNLTFTANWKANEYTVTIDLNGGKANKTTYTFTYDDVYQIEEPTRKGYVFDKFTWVNSNGVEEEFPSYGNKWNIPHNVRLIAQWNEATDTPFKTNIFIEKESVVDKDARAKLILKQLLINLRRLKKQRKKKAKNSQARKRKNFRMKRKNTSQCVSKFRKNSLNLLHAFPYLCILQIIVSVL